ncbi:MAG: hypothetical protein U2P59_03435 [Synergistota bacterium]|nr:hypothetical protein [Synergistota bacterium]
MHTLYARIKHNIILAIERPTIETYEKIDFRKADSFGLYLKKQIQSYSRLLSELNFSRFREGNGAIIFMCQNKDALLGKKIAEEIQIPARRARRGSEYRNSTVRDVGRQ